jgi:hypothetical protein
MQPDAESCTLLLILLKAVGEPLIRAPIVDEGDVVIERLTGAIAETK